MYFFWDNCNRLTLVDSIERTVTMDGIRLHQFKNQDVVRQFGKGLIIDLHGRRRVLSTSMLHGGISDSLSHVFNYNCLADEYDCCMHYDSYEKELADHARTLGLDPEKTTGLSTAAFVECASIRTKEYADVSVTAVVTAGIDHNGVRIGDPASYYEKSNVYTPLEPGTINILLYINHAMPEGAMVRAVTMCTEAKSAAIAELMLGSCYSTGIATGSGTDGTIIICDLETNDMLTDAGGHSKLGELIGCCVKEAVKEALRNQTSASPARQHSILERGRRYGVCISSLFHTYTDYMKSIPPEEESHTILSLKEFEQRVLWFHQNSNTVIFTSLYLHLVDQFQWKLIEWPEILRESKSLCHWYLTSHQLDPALLPSICYTTESQVKDLIGYYQTAIVLRICLSSF